MVVKLPNRLVYKGFLAQYYNNNLIVKNCKIVIEVQENNAYDLLENTLIFNSRSFVRCFHCFVSSNELFVNTIVV
jgi:hypothetical protein